MGNLLRWIPRLIFIAIGEMVLKITIMLARVFGMITFYWRRPIW